MHKAMQSRQRAWLVAVSPAAAKTTLREPLDELESLAAALGYETVGTTVQTRRAPDPGTYIGSGKIRELRSLIAEAEVDLVIFDNELSPRQGGILEERLSCMVWDRTQLIIEIFAGNARTAEAKTQVELARLKYMLPRVVGMWAHLDRERGGIGASRGMGEKQISVDRRIIRTRISRLEKKLEKINTRHGVRKKHRNEFLQACLIGYTNAGKSTVLNLLTGSRVRAEDRLFATLDATTRRLNTGGTAEILLSDTVGFIRSIPHGLVASFRSTLGVVRDADVLLHVVDAHHPRRDEHIATTLRVLADIGAADLPRLIILNKADLLRDEFIRMAAGRKYPGAVMVSALQAGSRRVLLDAITSFCRSRVNTVRRPAGRHTVRKIQEHA